MSWRTGGMVLLIVAMLTGCASMGAYREPVRVTVSDIRVLEATLLEQLYEVTVRIQNHNPEAIAIRGGSFDLEINGNDFGSGVTDQAVTVPGFSDAQLTVRMVSTVFGMLRVVQSLQAREAREMDYEISGRFSVDGALGGVGFHETGQLSLPARTGRGEVQ